jgi:hypothetical protein
VVQETVAHLVNSTRRDAHGRERLRGKRISKCNPTFYFAARFRGRSKDCGYFSAVNPRLFSGPTIALGKIMNFWKNRSDGLARRLTDTRHQFVIESLCKSALFQQKARLYYCIRCEWSFLVCGRKVAVLDEDGSPLIGEESLRRFETFKEGPCPVLEAFVSAASFNAGPLELHFRRKFESDPLASRRAQTQSARPWPALRVVSRV